MANVMLAARRSAAATLDTVAHTADAVSAGAIAISHLAHTGAAYAADYRNRAQLDITRETTRKADRLKHQRALEDAHFYKDMFAELQNDPALREYYNQALSTYEQAEAKIVPIAAE